MIRDGELQKKNADHSYGGYLDRMAAAGKPVKAEPGYSRTMLLSALAGDEITELDCPEQPLEVRSGDRLVICSDGLDILDGAEIVSCAKDKVSARAGVETLLDEVKAARDPRQDNTTVVVVHVELEAPFEVATFALEDDYMPPVATSAPPTPRADVRRAARNSGPRWGVIGLVMVVLAAAAVGAWMVYGPGLSVDTGPVELAIDEQDGLVGEDGLIDDVADEQLETEEPDTTASLDTLATGREQRPVAPPSIPFTDRLKGGGRGPKMVWIPAGTFEMGSPPSSPNFDERPRHTVTLGHFAIGVTEVRIDEYRRFARATGGSAPTGGGDSDPVASVSWDDANRYARWLSQQTGRRYRLPNEAEWEYAATAGSDSPYWWGYTVGQDDAYCFGCGSVVDPGGPTSVASFKPNPFGIYDTAGNVMEWVQDCYHENYDGAPDNGTVWSEADCPSRVARGGAFSGTPKSIRSQRREKFAPTTILGDIGIRLIREP